MLSTFHCAWITSQLPSPLRLRLHGLPCGLRILVERRVRAAATATLPRCISTATTRRARPRFYTDSDAECVREWDKLSASPRRPRSRSPRLSEPKDDEAKDAQDTDMKIRELLKRFCKSSDPALLAHMLDVSTQGGKGAEVLFKALYGTRSVHSTRPDPSHWLWHAIPATAARDEQVMQKVQALAEWFWTAYQFRWPGLYKATMVSLLMERRDWQSIVRWHMRLMPKFDPGRKEFLALLCQFIADPCPQTQSTLRAIYFASRHRSTYDILIPYLYRNGRSILAREWRKYLVLSRDFPTTDTSSPSQSFLQFVMAYYPTTALSEAEIEAANRTLITDRGHISTVFPHILRRGPSSTSVADEGNTDSTDSRADTKQARWIATSWLPLEMIIGALRSAGASSIGPLAMQALLLREPNANSISYRIQQLESAEMSVGSSMYARAVKYFAERRRDDLISALSQSDIHPELFDDPVAVRKMAALSIRDGNLQKYRLLIDVQLSVAGESSYEILNQIAATLAGQESIHTLSVLDDMATMGVDISTTNLELLLNICANLDDHVREHDLAGSMAPELAIGICRRLVARNMAVGTGHWKSVISHLGRRGRLDEMDQVCLEVADLYVGLRKKGGLIPLHENDWPDTFSSSQAPYHGCLPADMPTSHRLHPLRRIFCERLVRSIIRWGFRQSITSPQSRGATYGPRVDSIANFDLARGIKLVCLLMQRGVEIPNAVGMLTKAVVVRLVDLQLSRLNISPARYGAQLEVEAVKRLCDAAWGTRLLPNSKWLRSYVRATVIRRERMEHRRAILLAAREDITMNKTVLSSPLRL